MISMTVLIVSMISSHVGKKYDTKNITMQSYNRHMPIRQREGCTANTIMMNTI